jgi:hypothetical protein
MRVCCCKVAGCILLQEDLLDVSIKHQLQSEIYPRIKNITASVAAMENQVCMLLLRIALLAIASVAWSGCSAMSNLHSGSCGLHRQTAPEVPSLKVPCVNILQVEQTTNEALQEQQALEAELNRLAGLVTSFQRDLLQVRIGMQ